MSWKEAAIAQLLLMQVRLFKIATTPSPVAYNYPVFVMTVWAAYRRSLELGNEDSNVGPGRSRN